MRWVFSRKRDACGMTKRPPVGDPLKTTGQKATKKVNLDQVIKKEVEIFA